MTNHPAFAICNFSAKKNRQLFMLICSFALWGCSLPKSDKTGNTEVQELKVEHSMVSAAQAFLSGLSPDMKELASFPFGDKDRDNWHFVPQDDRQGARIGNMDEKQQELAFNLLKTGLSEKGYQIAREIMDLEKILIIKEKQKPGSDYRNPGKYYICIFGNPSNSEPWSWTYEGHHLSLNYSSVNDQLSVTPAFLGANPAEVDIEHEEKGKRVLGFREDNGRSFMLSLDADQQKKALVSTEAYNEVLTEANSYAKLEKFEGLPYGAMTPEQQTVFRELIQLHMNIMKPEVFDEQWAKVNAQGLDKFYFAWAGGLERNQKHYYRIHGPTTIMEYDNAQNNGNHAHIVWRDTENDFGRDFLKEHYSESKH